MHDPSQSQSVSDCVSLKRKVVLLTQRGLWPALEQVAAEHGWLSREVEEFAARHLPSEVCPVCERRFCQTTKRAKYCSAACRQAAANERDKLRRRAAPSGDGLPPHRQVALAAHQEWSVRLERGPGDKGDHRRFYALMVVQTLFGKTALIRRWGRTDVAAAPQTLTVELDSLDVALAELDRVVATCLKRGYRLLPAEPNPHASRVLRPGQVRSTAVYASPAAFTSAGFDDADGPARRDKAQPAGSSIRGTSGPTSP